MGDLEAGFAKLQGEDFEYYMQTYSIVLGRNSKKSSVDVDLASLGGGMHISRHHARIGYDFERRRFVLEVLGKNGCYVEGVLHQPGKAPVKLDSQDLLQIGDKKFYFLLPAKKIVRSVAAVTTPGTGGRKRSAGKASAAAKGTGAVEGTGPKKMRGQAKQDAGGGAMERQVLSPWNMHEGEEMMAGGSTTLQGQAHHFDFQRDGRRGEADLEILQDQVEEGEVITAVATILQEHSPGEWTPIAKLHSELMERYHGHFLSAKFARLVGPDYGGNFDGKRDRRPWSGLLNLLRRYPQFFIINTKLKGPITVEFVSLAI